MGVANGALTDERAAHESRRRTERQAVDQIVERLVAEFPAVPADAVARAVEQRYAEFGDSRVRDYLPVLLERSVRRRLAAR